VIALASEQGFGKPWDGTFDGLRELGSIKRKMLFRDELAEAGEVSIKEFIDHLGIGPISRATYSKRYKLVQQTLNAMAANETVRKSRFDSGVTYRLPDGEVKVHKEHLFQQWETALTEHRGRHRFTDLQRITGNLTDTAINQNQIPAFIEYVNSRDQIEIRRSSKGGGGRRYWIETGEQTRYTELKAQVPAHPELIDAAARRGRSPQVIAATLEWLLTDTTQTNAAANRGCSTQAIQNNHDWVQQRLET
jgi:hypothetical protein